MIGSESHEPFQGSVQQWIDQLLDTVERFGMNAFVFWPNEDHDRQRQIFAEQVVPEVRQALAG
ncbi:MAG: hypothetical protein L0I76_06475 [Pseudonocardia sp.]|nr:hypothetical protein [Pseudonocardia sp.]